jgi:anti-sigma factor RsiW
MSDAVDPGCTRLRLLVQAELDGELSVAEAAEVEAHLASCAACRRVRAELASLSRRLREVPRYAAPETLRRALQAQAAPVPAIPLRPRSRVYVGFAAATAMAIAAGVVLLLPASDELADQTVASHIRALQPGHLTDVLSSDQHTVKPWFDGRIDYAPPVRDFAADGFPLVGGRLDFLGGRAVAALVYRRDKHIIDLYVRPATTDAGAASAVVNGYNVLGWTAGGMRFTAVSDLNARELAAFAALWQSAPP